MPFNDHLDIYDHYILAEVLFINSTRPTYSQYHLIWWMWTQEPNITQTRRPAGCRIRTNPPYRPSNWWQGRVSTTSPRGERGINMLIYCHYKLWNECGGCCCCFCWPQSHWSATYGTEAFLTTHSFPLSIHHILLNLALSTRPVPSLPDQQMSETWTYWTV